MTRQHPPAVEAGGNAAADDGCRAGVEHPLTGREIELDVDALGALGNETRYEALRLVAATEGGTCGCEIEPALGVSQGAVSQALSRLHDAGLVTRRTEGRWRYYDATERAARLLDVIDETRPSDRGEGGRRP
ncbi:ArsR/SmtB family transcription factor [Halorubrum sp. HHNYT27]|uniref:ArsR/SmtB family transcription factor n=1 Tax=Halorubrum sp. HHNYT27 TaxID=3402275 RepID=UPI003EB9C561